MRLQARRQGGNAGTGHARGPLRCDNHKDQQADLFAQRQRLVHGIRNENSRHGEINGGTIQVEGITGGHDDAYGGLVHSHILHLAHQIRQGRLGRRRCENKQILAAQIFGQLENAEPGK